jgi:hypothetical protein
MPDALTSTASRPALVTTRDRPSVGRDIEGYASDLGQAKTEIFLQKGLDRPFRKTRSDLPVGQFGREPITQSGRRTSALARIPDSSRTSREVRKVPKAVIPATVFGQYLMIEFKPFKLLDRPLHQ